MAKKTKLAQYLNRPGISQRVLAEKLRITQGAISQMIVNKRDIEVVSLSNGVIELREDKLIATSAATEDSK